MNDIEMLRRIKERKGYTLDQMARAMGVTLRTIFRWLHKENAPSPMAQEKINAYIHAESVKEND
jgi:transcriptional regulator with XRE-family HTH domain